MCRVKAPADKREAAERALSAHVDGCPAATSLRRGIAIETAIEFTEE